MCVTGSSTLVLKGTLACQCVSQCLMSCCVWLACVRVTSENAQVRTQAAAEAFSEPLTQRLAHAGTTGAATHGPHMVPDVSLTANACIRSKFSTTW